MFALALLAVLAGVQRLLASTSKPAADPHGPPITVVIPSGATAVTIGGLLERAGVVEDGSRFRAYAKDQGEGAAFKAGRYSFRAGSDYDAIISRLDSGPPPPVTATLVVPEGFTVRQITARVPTVGISRTAYRGAVAAAVPPAGFGAPASMEGFLFPATYQVRPHQSASRLVAQQLDAFRAAFAQVDLSYARSKNLTRYDVLTIASMIEREAKVPGDRALVSAVIYNRLHRRMALGIDATLLYEQGSWTHKLTVSELHANTPYNTRVRRGLPPTPICNPGLVSIEAAAHPAHVDYIYYVAQPGSDRQYFTASYRDFVAHGG